jgi:hypothetical protein
MERSPEKRWYVRDRVAGQPRQVWLFDGRAATRIGVTNPESGAGTFFKAEPGEDFLDCIGRQTAWLSPDATEGGFHSMTLGPSEYYPRIARPIAIANASQLWSPSLETEKAFIASARGQLTLLARKLETICQTVQPSEETLEVYGHEIRNLLILAATEAEMHWRGIFIANGSQMRRLNSNEYVRLIEPLKLLDYTVAFHDFPDLEPIQPFAGWTKVEPTKSLGWYDAYHGVKHNREAEFERGTLRRAFEAVSACICLLVAQFGPIALNAELSSLIGLTVPDWPIGEMYIPRVTSDEFIAINYPSL